jgi:hypothetical protein
MGPSTVAAVTEISADEIGKTYLCKSPGCDGEARSGNGTARLLPRLPDQAGDAARRRLARDGAGAVISRLALVTGPLRPAYFPLRRAARTVTTR